MKPLIVHPIQTPIFHPGADLAQFVMRAVPKSMIQENVVLAVTSKIVSLAENQLVKTSSIDKKSLVESEADIFIGEIGYGCFLTVKDGLLIPSAGIDESNSETGDYILFPKDPFFSAETLRLQLKESWHLKNLGVIITDSHTTPLRRGVTGIALSYAGFRGVRNLVGTKDLFGRELRMTQMNFVDGLAGVAVMMMGEGAEARPLAMIENAEIEFCEKINREEIQIPLEEDLYFPLLKPLKLPL